MMFLLDWIYPPKCVACNMNFEPSYYGKKIWLCENCQPIIEELEEPYCKKCGRPLPEFDVPCTECHRSVFSFKSHRAAFAYDGLVRELLHNVKFRSSLRTTEGLGELFAKSTAAKTLQGSYIVPVPLHSSKKRSRGFNQALVLAEAVSKETGIPVGDMLKRTRKTVPQSSLDLVARKENLLNAFSFNDKYDIAGKDVILLDDIFTTSATCDACSAVLMNNGANSVMAISLAITTKTDT
ncbi:MAG: ComF family protein [Turicibacter sp.]|nr:ComF family protein [Turicibacter sp.]